MGFIDMLADIAKALGAFAIMLFSGVQGIDGFIMGDIANTDYVLMGVFVISMLFLFYMIQRMQATTY
jgi:hypothetical protein